MKHGETFCVVKKMSCIFIRGRILASVLRIFSLFFVPLGEYLLCPISQKRGAKSEKKWKCRNFYKRATKKQKVYPKGHRVRPIKHIFFEPHRTRIVEVMAKLSFSVRLPAYGPASTIFHQICDQQKVNFFKKWVKIVSEWFRMDSKPFLSTKYIS